jgi:hypothetical protein
MYEVNMSTVQVPTVQVPQYGAGGIDPISLYYDYQYVTGGIGLLAVL